MLSASGDGQQPIMLKPTDVYVLYKTEQAANTSCSQEKCQLTRSFENLGRSSCEAYVICMLYGNVCGDFGMQVAFGSDEKQDVCYSGVWHRGKIAPLSSMTIALWWLQGVKDNPSAFCFTWCTEDGEPPHQQGSSGVDGLTLSQLVRRAAG